MQKEIQSCINKSTSNYVHLNKASVNIIYSLVQTAICLLMADKFDKPLYRANFSMFSGFLGHELLQQHT